MSQIIKCALLSLLALMALSLEPRCALAHDTADIGLSDSSSYAELSAKYGEWGNSLSHHSLAMLGITELEYVGDVINDKEEQRWRFKTEPKIMGVDPNGPARDKLEEGDIIVAVDGSLITTAAAGRQFGNLSPGEQVELEIRRARQKRTVTIIPRDIPKPIIPIELIVRYTEQSKQENSVTMIPGRTILPQFSSLLDQIRLRQSELTSLTDSLGILASPQYSDRAPRGWIGFGLSFSGSIRRNDQGNATDWLFFELPSIKSISPGSPADIAGLQVDDVLLEINGKRLTSEKGGELFSHMEPGQVIEWRVQRGDKTFTVKTTAGQLPESRKYGAKPESTGFDTLQDLKFSGTIGNTEVEVRAGKGVHVEVSESPGETVIETGDAVIRLKTRLQR